MLSAEHKEKMQAGRREASAKARRETLTEIVINGSDCSCGITVATTDAELRTMRGCKDPSYVCPVLDKARRQLGVL